MQHFSLRDDTADVTVRISNKTKLPATVQEFDHLTLREVQVDHKQRFVTSAGTDVKVLFTS